jgi:predicted RNA-binding protein YlqC (UPF0109 family)
MVEFLEFIFKNLVDHPEQVEVVEENLEDGSVLYKIKVADEDMGQAIGKQGRIIKSVRQLVRTKAVSTGKRVVVQLNDPSIKAQA